MSSYNIHTEFYNGWTINISYYDDPNEPDYFNQKAIRWTVGSLATTISSAFTGTVLGAVNEAKGVIIDSYSNPTNPSFFLPGISIDLGTGSIITTDPYPISISPHDFGWQLPKETHEHTWKQYHGLNETDEYCETCSEKKK